MSFILCTENNNPNQVHNTTINNFRYSPNTTTNQVILVTPGQPNVDEELDNEHTDGDSGTEDQVNESLLPSDLGTGNVQQPESSSPSSQSKDEADGYYSSLRSDEGASWRENQEQHPNHDQCELAVLSCQTLKSID